MRNWGTVGIRCLAVLLMVAGQWGVAAAQEGASLVGRVLAVNGDVPFEGAVVRIPALERAVTTTREGQYRFSALPAGTVTVTVNYLGAEEARAEVVLQANRRSTQDFRIDAAEAGMGDVLVIGQAAGQAAAINKQRSADNLKSIASADAIGQFPDQNAAEALRRLPGVSVANDQGEGRFAIVRGIDSTLTATSINGIRVPSPEDDTRQVNLDVISSDLLESLEVVKTTTPDMDGDTVGGTIVLNSVTAFDRGNTTRISADGSYSEKAEEWSPRLSATATRLFSLGDGFENFGVAASVSWFSRDFLSDNVESAGWPELEAPSGTEIRGLEEAEQRDYSITRERLSASLSLDYRPSADDSYYLRTLFSDFADDELQVTNVFAFEEGDIEALSADAGRFSGAEVEKLSEAREETQQIFSVLLGSEHFRGLWEIDYQLGYSFANEDDPEALGFAFVGEDLNLAYDLNRFGSDTPFLSGENPAFTDAATYALNEIELEDNFTEEREWSLSADLKRDTRFGAFSGYLKSGVKLRLREKEADTEAFIYDDFGGDFTVADFTRGRLDYPFGDINPYADRGAARSFFFANRDNFALAEEDSALGSRIGDYDLDEDVYAGYVMASVDIGKARIFGGVRVEHTEFSAIGTEAVIDETTEELRFAALRADTSYTDVLPSLHLRYALSEATVLRAAYTQTLARPGFEAAAPRAEIEIAEDDGQIERQAEVGNPDLDPLRAQNVDLSIEHYPGGVAVLGAGVFYKRLDDFFVLSDLAGTGAFVDFDEAIATVNGEDADLFGIELNAVRQFRGLPSPFDGVLVSANYTWTDSEARLPFRDGDVPLPRQSDNLFNLALGYEKYGLSLRLAASYRDVYFDEVDELDDPAFDRYVDEHLQLDFTGKYRITEQLQVRLNVINITDEPFYAYFDQPRFNSQYEEYGLTAEVGLSYDF